MDPFAPCLSIVLLTRSLLEQGHFRQRANTTIDKYNSNIFLPMNIQEKYPLWLYSGHSLLLPVAPLI
jgi:hypothetical protein